MTAASSDQTHQRRPPSEGRSRWCDTLSTGRQIVVWQTLVYTTKVTSSPECVHPGVNWHHKRWQPWVKWCGHAFRV